MRELYEAERRSEHRNYATGHSFEEWLDHRRSERDTYSPYFTWDWRPYLVDYNPWQKKAPAPPMKLK